MKTTFLWFGVLAFLSTASGLRADYAMPPIGTVLKTAPLIVDATVTKADAKTGAAELKIHRVFRGTAGETLKITHTALSCTGHGPGTFGAKVGNRYVFILADQNAVYEETTFYPISEGEKPDELRITFPAKPAPAPREEISLDSFLALLEPAEPAKGD